MMRILVMLFVWWRALRRRKPEPTIPGWRQFTPPKKVDTTDLKRVFEDHAQRSITMPELPEAPEHRAHIDKLERAELESEWTDAEGRKWKRFAGGLVGEDITNLDHSDLEALRRVYGTSPYITDEQLQRWAKEAGGHKEVQRRITERLAEIDALPKPEVENTGYIPVTGRDAGSDPKHGVVLPPKVDDLTTREWCDLRLEYEYGPSKTPKLPYAAMGFSMRHLNRLRNMAEARAPHLTAFEIYVLRSRGLV